MCLPNFERFDNISEWNPLVGYRTWRLSIANPNNLRSEFIDYNWLRAIEGPHVVTDSDSGIYAYNYYNSYNYNNYNSYNYNSYNYNSYNYNYCIAGIIHQYGRVAIHRTGQRSEYAKITKLFTIRELGAKGPKEFLDWIRSFNLIIKEMSKKYECGTLDWQDFK